MISVCVPVGPYPVYKKYLPECLESIRAQTHQPYDVVLIDDMAGLTSKDLGPFMQDGDMEWGNGSVESPYALYRRRGDMPGAIQRSAWIWRAPWRLGIPAVANIGIALGGADLVFQMSCDDRMMPDCLAECWKEWERRKDPLGYYWVGIEYSTGETQALPCGHALVPKALWKHTGGFPPETAIGGCDATLISILMEYHGKAGTLYSVAGGRPLYWHREHDEQYTKHQNAHPSSQIDVRTTMTKRWEPIDGNWGRYEP